MPLEQALHSVYIVLQADAAIRMPLEQVLHSVYIVMELCAGRSLGDELLARATHKL